MHYQYLPPNMYPHAASLQTSFCVGLQQLGVCLFGHFWNYNCLFILDIALCFHALKQIILRLTITARLANIHSAEGSPHIVLLWFSLIFPRRVGVDVSEVQQTARELEAEAKFTSLCYDWCRSVSSVVMVTLVMREGLLSGPEGQAQSLWAGVRQTTPQK